MRLAQISELPEDPESTCLAVALLLPNCVSSVDSYWHHYQAAQFFNFFEHSDQFEEFLKLSLGMIIYLMKLDYV